MLALKYHMDNKHFLSNYHFLHDSIKFLRHHVIIRNQVWIINNEELNLFSKKCVE